MFVMKEKESRAEHYMSMKKAYDESKAIPEESHISNGYVYISFEKVEFEEKEVVPKCLYMTIPTDFKLMSEKDVRRKYPSDDRPDHIYTSEDTSVNISFSLDEEEVDNNQIVEIKDLVQKELERLNPSSEFTSDAITLEQENHEKIIGYFCFDSPVLDGDLYTFMFFVEANKKLVLGTFNCASYQRDEWEEILIQMLQTIKAKV